jgi:hypothetical protein
MFFRNHAFTMPSTHIQLLSADGVDTDVSFSYSAGSGKGLLGNGTNGYTYQTVNPTGGSSPAWSAVSARSCSNANAVTHGAASGSNWPQFTAAGLCDTDFTSIFYDNANVADTTVLVGESAICAIGACIFSIA